MSKYWKNVSVVLSGAMLAQLIPIVGALLITRLYTTGVYGLYSAWLAIVYIVAVMLSLRFEHALPIESDGRDREVGVLAVLLNTIGMAIFLSMILLLLWELEIGFFNEFSVFMVFFITPAAVFVALNNLWQGWAAADGAYRYLNLFRVLFAGFVVVFQVLIGFYIPTENALVISHTLGVLISFLFILFFMPINIGFNKEVLVEVFLFWKRRKRFLIYSLPADLINTSSAQLPVLIVTSRFGPEVGGVLALTMRILGAPIGILGKAVLDVFKRYAADEYRKTGGCRGIYVKTLKTLTVGSVVFCFFVFLGGELFFRYVFGVEWAEAGVYAVWLLPMFAMRFIASPLSYTIYIVEKQGFDLVWQVSLLAVTIGALLISSGYQHAITIYSFGYAFMYVVYLYMTFKLSSKV